MDSKSFNEILADKSQFKNSEIYVADANTTYIGYAKPNGEPVTTSAAIWLIVKISTSGGTTSIRLADNLDNFTLIWDNFLTYTY